MLKAVPFDALTTADEDPAAQLHAGRRPRVGDLKQNNKFRGFFKVTKLMSTSIANLEGQTKQAIS